ncbi:MAG: AAA family ATPase [Sulfuricurvum sp.]
MINTVDLTNFKCFEHLYVNGLQSVNLIGGKNNIGKTSFMESLELFLSSRNTYDLAFNIYKMIRRRQHNIRREKYIELDFIYQDYSKIDIIINNQKIAIEYFEQFPELIEDISSEENLLIQYQPSLKLLVNNEESIFPISRIIEKPIMVRRDIDSIKERINFISSATTEEREIAIYYGKLVTLNKENFLNDSLHLFDENIVALKQIVTERDVILKLLLKNRATPVLLSSLGEGINRYIAILCAIWASQDGYLFIDEIENGIHYTNYPKLWEVIFEASKMANCQIFITTHSKECIEAFNKVNSENNGTYIEFYRSKKTDQINVKQRDKEQLEYSLSHNGEFRGE